MSNDSTARRIFGVSYETLIRRIVRTFDRASASDVEAGARWYPEAGALAADLSGHAEWFEHELTTDQVAVIIAHMSPRTSWTRNVAAATEFARTGQRFPGIMGDLYERALASLEFGDPFDSFGPDARKTRSFAQNILGDRETVTVDVWALRVVGFDDDRLLKRVGAYDVLADAYRAAARRRGVDPSTMQATTWIVARDGRSS